MTDKRLYAKRKIDSDRLNQLYIQHVKAMTTENLHHKSDIAAELAERDARIAELKRKTQILATILTNIETLVMEAPEINLRNYDEDEIIYLNESMIDIYKILKHSKVRIKQTNPADAER